MRVEGVRWSDAAEIDLNQIVDWYLERADYATAERFTNQLEEALARLAEYPLLGTDLHGWLFPVEGMRRWSLSTFPYTLFYWFEEDYLSLARILHTSRDIPKHLQQAPLVADTASEGKSETASDE